MRSVLLALGALGVLAALPAPGPAAAAGAWSSYAKPSRFSALRVEGDTVWCATLEAGLLRFVGGAGGGFTSFLREPGRLSSNRLTALAIARDGRLWVGTDGAGVSRLSADRASWDLVSAFDGLPSDSITTLEVDGDSIWIGTTRGVALWNGREIAGAIPNGFDPSPFANDHITGIVPRGDSLWISTLGGVYVSRMSTGFQSWSLVTGGLYSPNALGLARSGNSLFTYGDQTVYRLNDSGASWSNVGSGLNIGFVAALTGQSDRVIVSTSRGLWRWESGWSLVSDAFASGTDPLFTHLVGVAGSGKLWTAHSLGLWEQGSTPYDWPRHDFSRFAPPGNDVINLHLQGNSVYVTTFNESVGRFDGLTWRNWAAVPCGAGCDTTFLSPFYTFALHVDARGHKWVACWSSVLEEFDDSQSPPQFIHHTVNDPVTAGPERHTFGWAAANDRDGGIWIGLDTNGIVEPSTPLGLDYFDANGDFVRNFRPDSFPDMQGSQIRAMLWDPRNDRMWVGYSVGSKGLDYFGWPLAGGVPDFTRVPAADNLDVIGLARYGDSLWVLTTTDLRRLDARSGNQPSASTFSKPGAAADNSLHPLDVGPDGTVWMGSENGLRALHPGNQVEDFTTANSPLLDNRVKAVRVDPVTGVVWIATGAGVNRHDPFYVAPADTVPARLSIQVLPNPARITALGVPIRLRGGAVRYDVEVLDMSGRRVRRVGGVGYDQVFWDGRDDDGNLVRPGLYIVRAESGGRSATARVTLLR